MTMTTPPAAKKMRHLQKFKKEYTEKWPCITIGKKSDNYAFCEVCCLDFSIKSGGQDDCRRHVESKKHEDLETLHKHNQPMSGFFTAPKTSSKPATDTIRAEVMLVDFTTELNLPFWLWTNSRKPSRLCSRTQRWRSSFSVAEERVRQ